jgi:large subunit ribosomal protein L5e
VIAAEIKGDRVLCSASSQELPRYGLKVGLKNYCAAYATGLLIARRLLKQLDLDETYTGNDEPDGEVRSWTASGEEIAEGQRVNAKKYYVELDEEADRKPFRCYLDIGIKTATRGSRVFSVMKGAVDGGLDIPHNNKRFPGYDPDAKTFDADDLKEHIFGGHIAQYMEMMEEDDEENYQKYFKGYNDLELDSSDLEKLYEDVFAAIREDPEAKKGYTFGEDGTQSAFSFSKTGKEIPKTKKTTYAARKAKIAEKKAALVAANDE